MSGRVNQLLQTFSFGDAISDHALALRATIRGMGVASDIYASMLHPAAAGDVRPFEHWAPAAGDRVLFHYAIASDMSERVAAFAGRKALVYHNITPDAFFRPYDPEYADLLAAGRRELTALAPRFDMLLAVSDYNAAELRSLSNRPVERLPLAYDLDRFANAAASSLLGGREKTGPRWLAVGRIAPNKGLLRMIDAFSAFVAGEPDAELILVGRVAADDRYYQALRERVRQLALDGRVFFAGSVTTEELLGWYASADVYVTLSDHEGFCVPLLEAMFFDVPIVANAATAIPETLGRAGLLVEPTAQPREIAALVSIILRDETVRRRVIDAQRERRTEFDHDAISPKVTDVVRRLLGQT